jgi:hypothetical protein
MALLSVRMALIRVRTGSPTRTEMLQLGDEASAAICRIAPSGSGGGMMLVTNHFQFSHLDVSFFVRHFVDFVFCLMHYAPKKKKHQSQTLYG